MKHERVSLALAWRGMGFSLGVNVDSVLIFFG